MSERPDSQASPGAAGPARSTSDQPGRDGSPSVFQDATRSCDTCGAIFAPRSARHRFCSARCKDQHRYPGAGPRTAICLTCARAFDYVQATKPRLYCDGCATAPTIAGKRRSAPSGKRRLCRCGAPALSQRHHYCGPCRQRAGAKRRRARDGRRRDRSGDPRSTYKWQRLARRLVLQATTCAICGRVLPKDAPPRSPYSPSVDHIVPLALGGAPFEPANLQVVHLSCNTARRNRQPELRRRGRARPRVVRVPAESWLGGSRACA
jgi:hypothetical protein